MFDAEKAIADMIAAGDVTVAEVAAARAELKAALLNGTDMLIDDGRESGTREVLRFDEAAELFVIQRTEDLEPTFELNRQAFNAGLVNRYSEMRRIASMPTSALEIWAREQGYRDLPQNWFLKREYHRLVLRAAHDRDMEKCRTLPGHFLAGARRRPVDLAAVKAEGTA